MFVGLTLFWSLTLTRPAFYAPATAPILYFAALIGKAQVGYMMKPALVFVLGAYLPVVLLVWRIFGTANRTGGRFGAFHLRLRRPVRAAGHFATTTG